MISDTGQKVLEKYRRLSSISDTGWDVLQKMSDQQRADYFNTILPPDPGSTHDTSPQVFVPNPNPLKNVLYNGLLGGATLKDYGQVAKMIGQGAARGYAVTGELLQEAATHPTTVSMKDAKVDPNTFFGRSETAAKVGKWFFGTDQPFSAEEEGRGTLEFFHLENATQWEASTFAVLLTSLDLFTGGAGSGAKGFLRSLKAAEKVDDVVKVMRTAGFDADIIESYAEFFARTTDEAKIADGISAALELQNTTRKVSDAAIDLAEGYRPVLEGGELFTDTAKTVRETLTETIKTNMKAFSDFPEQAAAVAAILRSEKLSLNDYRRAVTAIEEVVGTNMSKVTEQIDELSTAVKQAPEKFIPDFGELKASGLPGRAARTMEVTGDDLYKVELPVRSLDEVGKIEIKDGRIVKTGDIPVTQFQQRGAIKIADGTYSREGDIFVSGTKEGKAEAIQIVDRSGANKLEVVSLDGEVVTRGAEFFDNPNTLRTKPVEVADPVRDELSVVGTDLQARYGDKAITTANVNRVKEMEKAMTTLVESYREMLRNNKIKAVYANWVPEHLRHPQAFENLMRMLQNGDRPALHGASEMELYLAFVDELAKRSGIKTKPLRNAAASDAIIQAKNERLGKRVERVTDDAATKDPNVKLKNEEVPNYGKEVDEQKAYGEEFAKHERSMKRAPGTKEPFKPGELEKMAPDLQDISGFKGRVRDMWRNSERVFGKHWPQIKARIFDPLDDAKGRMVDAEKAETDALMAEIVEGLGIKRKSKLSTAVMDYGEKLISYDELVKRFGKEDAAKVVKADKWFRTQYDRMIDELNAVKRAIYPGNKSKLIPKRTDYYRHFQEMGGLHELFEDPGLGNLSGSFKPKQKWKSIEQARKGNKTERDAVSGFLNYIKEYAYGMHIDLATQDIVAFTKQLDNATNRGLDNYINALEMMTDDLLGRANALDRGIEGIVGRRVLNAADWLNKRVKRNAILGNAGTAVSQIFNVPNAIGHAGPVSTLQGIKRTLGDIFTETPAWHESTFVRERYKNDLYTQFNVGMLEHSQEFAGWLISILDEVGTKAAWNMFYEKALKLGDVDAVRYADEWTRKSVAGRGVGEVPMMQKSKVFQMVAPFQLEVANTLFVLGDMAKGKKAGQLATWAVATYLLNETAERVTGREVTMNPLQAVRDCFEISLNEKTVKEKGQAITGRLLGEAFSGVPLSGYVSAAFLTDEEQEILGFTLPSSSEFFGDADPIKYGVPQPLLWRALNFTDWDSALDPFFDFVTPWGGAQIQKTIKGITALAEGGVYDMNGNKMMDTKPGAAGAIQNILFGHWNPNVYYKDKVEQEVMAIVKENEALIDTKQEHNYDLARQNYSDLSPKMQEVYKEMKSRNDAAEGTRRENALRPTLRVIESLKEQGRLEDARAITAALSEEEQQDMIHLYERIHEPETKPKEMWIQEALDYAYAFGTNPVQAWTIVFKNHDHIEDTVGGSFTGLVRARRMDYLGEGGSEDVKQQLGHEKGDNLILEHKLPLSLGGSNMMSNLELVPANQHDEWTPVEVYLAKAVREKRIDWETAQKLILRHKRYDGEYISFEDIKSEVENN